MPRRNESPVPVRGVNITDLYRVLKNLQFFIQKNAVLSPAFLKLNIANFMKRGIKSEKIMQQVILEEKACQIIDLGLMDYGKVYFLQKKYVEDVCRGGKESLLICEHPSVLTLGRLARRENIIASPTEMKKRKIEILDVDRGGEVTLHSPGQLVIYPILNLKNDRKDLKYYLHKLEQVVIDFLREFDILACRISNSRGAWVEEKKIASIGIGVKKWVSFHGMAINVNTDLNLFSLIKPCGLDAQMTSIREIKGQEIDLGIAKTKLIKTFCQHFNRGAQGMRLSLYP